MHTERQVERKFRPRQPVHLGLTLGPLQRGRGDPCTRIGVGGAWRATRTPDGPATEHLTVEGDGCVRVTAWGPGAAWAVEHAPALVGSDDDDRAFVPRHPLLRDLHRRLAGLRIPRSSAVFEALVPTIIEQKVVGIEAKRSYARLVRALGEPAPGPMPLLLPPAPGALVDAGSWVFHRCGIERKRADAVRVAASYATRLDEAAGMARADGYRRLTALPGIGPWTAAEVGIVALGDADAVSIGDYHLPHHVSWALAGEARGTDERMLELLEPYRGQRGRVLRLLVAGAPGPPRFGPRMPLQRIAAL